MDDADSEPFDLTGYQAKSQIKKSYYSTNASAQFTITIPTPVNGVLSMSISAANTANISAGRYVYDVLIKNSSNNTTRVLEGIVNIVPQVTKLGGVLGLQFAKYPEKLTKSLLVTKALGMDLGKVDQIAGSLLNFESAIQNQLEAQLITGKDINLSAAQQLALQGDTAGVAMELIAILLLVFLLLIFTPKKE